MCTRDRIIRYAKDAIGCAYDETPSGGVEGESYNCSFLTFCAYRAAGLEIPTWQGHQNGKGSQSDWVRWVGNWTYSINELTLGDLVFFGVDPYDTFHVGIYADNGMMIDSVPMYGVSERPVIAQSGFVGGGWPFKIEYENEVDMPKILVCDDVWMYFDGHDIHDMSEPEDIDTIREVYANIPTQVISEETYARLCQILKAGYPKALMELSDKYPPRSFR